MVIQSFKIKSSVRDYHVVFSDFKSHFNNIYQDGDVVICDSTFSGLVDGAILIDATEESKEYLFIQKVIAQIIEAGFKKNKKIIAIGGGVIQDICGFIASLLYRGVEWVFYPTTLLSQGDSCIGGKSSINFGKYKNQLGTFNPPSEICIDIEFLKTLPKNQMDSGFGEMAHYFIISSKENFYFLRDNWNKSESITSVIQKSLLIKKKFIELDEFDKGERQLLNYGHSFGHAIESITKYKVPHGIAVAQGMILANTVSNKMKLANKKFSNETKEFLTIFAGDFNYDTDTLIEAMSKDKKNTDDRLTVILTKGYGNVFKTQIEKAKLKKILNEK